MSVSSVSGLTQITDSFASSALIQCSEKWIQMQHNFKLEEKQNIKTVETYVKQYLFKDFKFIPLHKKMIYSTQELNLSYLVCHNLNIKAEHYHSFWSKYSKFVEKAINAARSNAVQAVKKLFLKGKNFHISCISIVILQTVYFLYK